jgi:hypothetical protein
MSTPAEDIVRRWAQALHSGNSMACNGDTVDSWTVDVVLADLEKLGKLTAAVKRAAYVWEHVDDPTAHLYPRDVAKVLRETLAAVN